MNWDRIAGSWKQLKGDARRQWGRLTGDDLGMLAGKREHLRGEIQSAQGVTTEARETQLAEWLASEHKADPIHK